MKRGVKGKKEILEFEQNHGNFAQMLLKKKKGFISEERSLDFRDIPSRNPSDNVGV